jgi:heterodisulfide reductase subunit D
MCTYGDWPNNYTICPMYLYDKSFTYSGGGFMYMAKSLIEKKLEFDSRVSDLLFTCSGCLACDDICEIISCSEPYVRTFDIIRLMRHEMVKKGLVSTKKLERVLEQMRRYEKYVSSGNDNILAVPEKIYDKNSDKVFFVEWAFLNSQPEIYNSVLRLFEKIGKPIFTVSDRGLNLSDLYDLGFWDEIKEHITRKIDIRKLKGKELIFINPHSQEFIVHRYPEVISGFKNITISHISEYVLNALEKGDLRMKRSRKEIKVSYHDPCYLGRGLGIYDPPRKLISSIDGVKLVEMERNKRNSFCCGARAGDDYFPDFSKKTSKQRLKEFKKTEADLLITACPYCKTALSNVLNEKDKYRVKDLVEFIEEHAE